MATEEWSEEEFAAAVGAYLDMLEEHANGRPINRAEVRRQLRDGPLSARSDSSIEYRMQNISAVMELLGRPILPGYLPARNVGARGTRIISALIEGALEPESDEETEPTRTEPLGSRVFVTGMWGYNPAREGYVGFTNQSTRDRLIALYQPGDLMLIVGQRGEYSDERDVGRLLGIVDLAPEPILEPERMSPEAYREKVAKFGADRWRYALPIKRAWIMGREVKANAILPISYAHKFARSVGSSFRQLTPEETARVLGLPVRPVSVWGEPEWQVTDADGGRETTVANAASRGPKPWFGKSEANRVDGETKLYLMTLTGCLDALFPKRLPKLRQKTVIKVGRSNDPVRRLVEMNCGFPVEAEARWELAQVQSFATANEAHEAEQRLLADLEAKGSSLGGEFAIIPSKEVATLLAAYVGSSAFHIPG
jgi:hypothetical protein